MKYLIPVFVACIFMFVSGFSQTETVFYPLKINAHDSSGHNRNGRLTGGAIVDNYLEIPYNEVSLLHVPPVVINGLMHYSIEFSVYFDSLHTFGTAARNTVADGSYQCGDSRVDIFYNEVGRPLKSWVVLLEGVQYVFHDPELRPMEWDNLRIEKRNDSVKMFRNARLLGTLLDKSDTLNILTLQLGQAQSCDGSVLPMCMDGRLRNFKITSYDRPSAGLSNAAGEISVKSNTSVLNVYPNPSNGIIAVSLDKMTINANQPVVIKVFNNFGQTVKEISSPLTKNPIQLDLSNMPAGIYFIRTESGNSASTAKVVIK